MFISFYRSSVRSLEHAGVLAHVDSGCQGLHDHARQALQPIHGDDHGVYDGLYPHIRHHLHLGGCGESGLVWFLILHHFQYLLGDIMAVG